MAEAHPSVWFETHCTRSLVVREPALGAAARGSPDRVALRTYKTGMFALHSLALSTNKLDYGLNDSQYIKV